jgi:chromosome partitioning protein
MVLDNAVTIPQYVTSTTHKHMNTRNSDAYTKSMIISIASQKGGVGKTTTTISVAAGLAHRGCRVLLIDTDSQANASKILISDYSQIRREDSVYSTIVQRKALPITQTSVHNLDIVPAHILLADTDIELSTAKDHREARLKRELDKVKDGYDSILIDCPPNLGWLTLDALTAADAVVVVVAPGYFELDSIVQISKTIAEVHEYFNSELKLLGYLFARSTPTVNTKLALKILRQTYTNQVLDTIIPENTDIREALFNKKDIFMYSPDSKSAQAYKRLIEELFP